MIGLSCLLQVPILLLPLENVKKKRIKKDKKLFFISLLVGDDDVLKIGTCGVLNRAVDSNTRYNRYTCR